MPLTLSRRTLIGAGLATALGATAYTAFAPYPAAALAPENPPPVTVTIAPGLRLHMIQTGWVSVKTPHRRWTGPDALRLPAVILSRSFTEWMPVRAWVIEHPDGLFVVDTGETAAMTDPASHLACSPGDAWFYGRNLRFTLTPDQEIGPQMRALGLDPARVRDVVMTHLHSDHTGGMKYFPTARFLISQVDFGGHLGAVPCAMPDGLQRIPLTYTPGDFRSFGRGANLTPDGSITVVPTPGHSPGHQSVVLRHGNRTWIIGGDAAFNIGQVLNNDMAGIVADPKAARATLATLRSELGQGKTLFLASHDPDNAAALAKGP